MHTVIYLHSSISLNSYVMRPSSWYFTSNWSCAPSQLQMTVLCFPNDRYLSGLKSWIHPLFFLSHTTSIAPAVPVNLKHLLRIQPTVISSLLPPWSSHHHLLHGLLWQSLNWSLCFYRGPLIFIRVARLSLDKCMRPFILLHWDL